MFDFASAAIMSLENVFPGIAVYLCDFHRDKTWHRYK